MDAPARRSRFLALGAVIVVLVLLAGGAAFAALGGREGKGAPAPPEPPPRWDPRLLELVAVVEELRNLEFEHPVRTDFLDAEAFAGEVSADAQLSKEDAAQLAHVAGLFRALGLVEGELDLQDAADQLNQEIVGLYDPVADRIVVRGDRVTPAMRPTIVHELTHALQAQHFDLDREHETSGQDTAFTALVEADALRVQEAYVAGLPEEVRVAVEAQLGAEAAEAEVGIEEVPPILTELFSLPYVLGPPFLESVGPEGIDAAFRQPPSTEEHIIDPATFLAGDGPATVRTPALDDDEVAVGEPDDFGMLSLLLVLGERLPFAQAWSAVQGWSGDASIGYQRQGRDCIKVRTQLDSDGDAEELLLALQAWAGDRDVSPSRRGTVVNFRSCDPGTATVGLDPDRPRTFELLQLRSALLTSLEAGGLDAPTAACVADDVLRDHDAVQLLEVATIEDPADERLVSLQRDVQASTEECKPG